MSSKVKAVPDGYSTVTPFLNVKGAGDAIEFYKKAFGATERSRMATPDGTIMHAEIQVGNAVIMIAEAMMNPPTHSSLHCYVEDADASWKRAVDAGCTIEMPIADQFWGDRYGVLSDKFGNRWAFATHKEDVTPEEQMRRMMEMMANMKK